MNSGDYEYVEGEDPKEREQARKDAVSAQQRLLLESQRRAAGVSQNNQSE